MNTEVEVYLRIFCTYAQTDWAKRLPGAMMALNNRMNQSIGMSPFFLIHGYNGSVITPSDELEGEVEALSPIEVGSKLVGRWRDTAAVAQAAMASAQYMQERNANRHQRAYEALKVGDRVYLHMRNIKTDRTCKKLDWVAQPYKVLEAVGTHSYRLNVPHGIHDVFHASLLRRQSEDPLPSQRRENTEPAATLVQGENEWEIEEVVRHRRRGRGWQVLVKWVGYTDPT